MILYYIRHVAESPHDGTQKGAETDVNELNGGAMKRVLSLANEGPLVFPGADVRMAESARLL